MRAVTGWLCVAVGAVLSVPQLVAERPWQAGFLLGLGLMVAGALAIAERAPRR